jgi:replicative DNA helicase
MIQLQMLCYLLQTKDYSIIELNNIDVRFFSDYVKEFNFIKNHYEQYGNVPDPATFLNAFSDFELIQVAETPQYLLKALIDDFNTRQLTVSFNKVRKCLMEEDDIDKALKEFTKTQESLVSNIVMQPVDLVTDTKRYEDYVARTQDFGKFYILTGFDQIDKIISGIDREEELFGIGARTNFGKSWALLYIATSCVKQGLRVGLYSGEMSERKVGYRFDTLMAHFNNGSLTHGNIGVQNDYKRYIDSLPQTVKGSLKVLTPLMIGGYATVNTLKVFIEKENLDILLVDQLSLLEDQRGGKNATERLSNISKDLKNLQVMVRKPIVYVCQQNRTKNEDGSIDTTQIAGSDRIGQDATTFIFIDRPKGTDIMKFIIGKVRDNDGVGKEISYHVDLNTGNFVYIPEGEEDGGEDLENRYGNDTSTSSDGEDVFE